MWSYGICAVFHSFPGPSAGETLLSENPRLMVSVVLIPHTRWFFVLISTLCWSLKTIPGTVQYLRGDGGLGASSVMEDDATCKSCDHVCHLHDLCFFKWHINIRPRLTMLTTSIALPPFTRLHGRRGKGMAESFSREKLRQAPQKEGGWKILCYLLPVWPRLVRTSVEVQKEWEENTQHINL